MALGLVGVLALWQLLAAIAGGTPPAIPAPLDVVETAWHDRDLYAQNVPPTLELAAYGYLIGNAIAIALGAVIALSPVGRRQSMAVVVALYNVPVIAVAPLLQVLLVGNGPQIATAAICVLFTTLLGTVTGLRAADQSRLDVVHAAGGGAWAAIVKVRVRYAVPAVFAGLAVGIPYALVGAIIGEFLGGRDSGLGPMLVQGLSDLDGARVWGICILVGLLGAIGLGLATWASGRLFAWGDGPVEGRAPGAPQDAPLGRRVLAGLSTALTAAAVVAIVWVGGTRAFSLEPFVVKMPWDVWGYLVSGDGADIASRSDLWSGLVATLWRSVVGCLLGIVAGLAIALAIVRSAQVRSVLRPLLVVISCVPHLALVPVLALALGRGLVTTLVMAGLIALLPTVVNLETGLRSTPRGLRDVLHARAASGWQRLTKLELPVALPYLFTSLRIAAPWSLLGVLYAEWLATGGGIGSFMVEQSVNGSFDAAWSAAAVTTIAAVGLYLVVEFLERRVLSRFAPERLA